LDENGFNSEEVEPETPREYEALGIWFKPLYEASYKASPVLDFSNCESQ
jgi:hypothetical protein